MDGWESKLLDHGHQSTKFLRIRAHCERDELSVAEENKETRELRAKTIAGYRTLATGPWPSSPKHVAPTVR